MTATATFTAERQLVVPQSKREVAIEAVMREAGCTRALASSTIDWIQSMVADSRRKDYDFHYPRTKALKSARYAVLERLIPHEGVAKPGSAHSAIEDLLLDPSKDEFSIEHQMLERGGRFYCSFRVAISVMRVRTPV